MLQMKLRTQILLYFMVCITIVFAIQLFVVQTQMRELKTTQIQSLNGQLVQSKADEIGGWLNQRLSEIRIASQQQSIQQMDIPNALDYLDQLNDFAGGLYGDVAQPFVIVDRDGYAYQSDGSTLDVSQREFFQQAFASQREYTISKPLYSRLEWQRVVIITYPIYQQQERAGYILGSLRLTKLSEILSDVDLYGGSVWIMDDEGRVLAEDDNHTHGSIATGCPKGYSFTQAAAALAQQQSGEYRLSLEAGAPETLLYASIPYTQGWKLCVLASQGVMDAPMNQVTQSIFFVWALLIFAMALFSLVYVKSVVRPLDQLVQAMDEIDLDHPAQYQPCGPLEIQRLTHSFNRMTRRIHLLLGQVLSEQASKQEAERRVLQAQINPHFLYNTLDTIAWKAMEYGAAEVADLISALSRFFRISLSGGKDFITLDEEAEHVYSYLFIQQVRYEDKLDFSLYLDDRIRDCRILKLLLQPLVENAIYHGIKPKEGKGMLYVRICPVEDTRIEITVADNGVGLAPEQVAALQNDLEQGTCTLGFGLCSIAQRLRLTYGPEYGAQINSRQGVGTAIVLTIPLEREE